MLVNFFRLYSTIPGANNSNFPTAAQQQQPQGGAVTAQRSNSAAAPQECVARGGAQPQQQSPQPDPDNKPPVKNCLICKFYKNFIKSKWFLFFLLGSVSIYSYFNFYTEIYNYYSTDPTFRQTIAYVFCNVVYFLFLM